MTHYNTSDISPLRCAGLLMDTQRGLLSNAAGRELRLSPIALKLLRELVVHAGKPVLRAQLFDCIWPNQTVSDEVLTRAVSDLRAQLAQLDPASQFIETLPRRGYCWRLPIAVDDAHSPSPTPSNEADLRHKPVVLSTSAESSQQHKCRKTLVVVAGHIAAGTLLALVFMVLFVQLVGINRYRIAVLPTQPERPVTEHRAHWLDDLLVAQLRKNKRLDLLSTAAVASRPAKPFPYFNAEFGARWVLEPRLHEDEGEARVDIALVDARTGLEVRSLRVEALHDSELSSELARRLDDWLIELD